MATVTVFGGTGFLGRRIVERLIGAGEIVRVAARDPSRGRADCASVLPFAADVRDEKAAAAAVAGADAVVNAVSAYVQKGGVTYTAVHVQGALNVARACQIHHVSGLVHISGIGADAASPSTYIRARGLGEQKVRQAFAPATVLRPSVMFAEDGGLLSALAALAGTSPVVPLIGGGSTRLQPVHADDVAQAACAALRDNSARGAIYELGGPESFTLREIVQMILVRIGRRRILMPLPFRLADPLAYLLQALPSAPLTVAQVDLLRSDNVPALGSPGLSQLGVVSHRIQETIAKLESS